MRLETGEKFSRNAKGIPNFEEAFGLPSEKKTINVISNRNSGTISRISKSPETTTRRLEKAVDQKVQKHKGIFTMNQIKHIYALSELNRKRESHWNAGMAFIDLT